MTKVSKADKAEAIAELTKLLRPGDTIYTRLDHTSSSGMMRHVTPLLLRVDATKAFNSPRAKFTGPHDPNHGMLNAGEDVIRRHYLGYLVSKACDYTVARDHSLKVSGCGFDSGFDIVYAIGATIYADGYDCIGEGCPSNDHSNARGQSCPICGNKLERSAWKSLKELPADSGRAQWLGDSGPDGWVNATYEGVTPMWPVKGDGRVLATCSAECGAATWHHSDGGYAFTHVWL